MISRILKSAVFWGLLSTGLSLGGFIFVLPFALRALSPEYLGVWYTMQSLGALAFMIEAGFSPSIGRFANYFAAGAREIPSLGLGTAPAVGAAPPNLPGLAGLVRMARNLYLRFAAVMLVLMGVGGSLWFSWKYGAIFSHTEVWTAYLLYTVGMALTMVGLFWFDMLFGINRVQGYYANNILGQVLNYAVTLTMLFLGYGLLALAMGQLVSSLLPRWLSRRQFLKEYPVDQVKHPEEISWRKLWPVSWRSAVTSIAIFLMLRNLTLLAGQVIDLPTTASLGLSFQFCFVLCGVSQLWVVVKYPTMGTLRVQKQKRDLRRLVATRLLCSAGTYAAGAVCVFFLAPLIIHWIGSRTNLLPSWEFALLLAVVGLDLLVNLAGSILQTSNTMPHLKSFVISGIATTLLGLTLGYYFGIVGLILAPFLVQVCWNYGWTARECYRSLRD